MKKVSFYNVRKKETVEINVENCIKCSYENETKTGKKVKRYAVKSEDEGTKLTKFISKDNFDSLECVEE